MSLTKLSRPGIIKLSPARDSLIRDIPAGDGKFDNLFYSVVREQAHETVFVVALDYFSCIRLHTAQGLG
jgi:hypothetical protein